MKYKRNKIIEGSYSNIQKNKVHAISNCTYTLEFLLRNWHKKLTFFSFFLYVLLVHFLSTAPFAEAVKVNIEFINPLQISIPISGVALICKYSASTDELTSGKL